MKWSLFQLFQETILAVCLVDPSCRCDKFLKFHTSSNHHKFGDKIWGLQVLTVAYNPLWMDKLFTVFQLFVFVLLLSNTTSHSGIQSLKDGCSHYFNYLFLRGYRIIKGLTISHRGIQSLSVIQSITVAYNFLEAYNLSQWHTISQCHTISQSYTISNSGIRWFTVAYNLSQ